MTRLYRVLLITLAVLLVASASPVAVASQSPYTPPLPPVLHSPPLPPASPDRSLDVRPLQHLHAILIVGYGVPSIYDYVQGVNAIGDELASHGVTLHKFYPPNDRWSDIVQLSHEVPVHFLVYWGHGVWWGSPTDGSQVGGFCLEDGCISPDRVRSELRLAPGAIVMMFACYTAGSAGGEAPITSETAKARVEMYSDEFFDIGAAGYYATWYTSDQPRIIRLLFQGKTLREAYEMVPGFYFHRDTVERYTTHRGMALYLNKEPEGDGKGIYNNAFTGQPGATLLGLFGAFEHRSFLPLAAVR